MFWASLTEIYEISIHEKYFGEVTSCSSPYHVRCPLWHNLLFQKYRMQLLIKLIILRNYC